MVNDVNAIEVKKYFFSGKGSTFRAEYGGERCQRYNNLFKFLS